MNDSRNPQQVWVVHHARYNPDTGRLCPYTQHVTIFKDEEKAIDYIRHIYKDIGVKLVEDIHQSYLIHAYGEHTCPIAVQHPKAIEVGVPLPYSINNQNLH